MGMISLDPKRSTAVLFPGMSTLVTCKEGDKDNIIAITWQSSLCGDPPTVGISVTPKRFSYNLIKNSGEYIINIPNRDLLWELHYCGRTSGRDVDKFKETGLTREKASILEDTPQIKECIAHVECKICKVYSIANDAYSFFVADVVGITVDDRYFDKISGWKTGIGNTETLHYLGGTRYAVLGETLDYKDIVRP